MEFDLKRRWLTIAAGLLLAPAVTLGHYYFTLVIANPTSTTSTATGTPSAPVVTTQWSCVTAAGVTIPGGGPHATKSAAEIPCGNAVAADGVTRYLEESVITTTTVPTTTTVRTRREEVLGGPTLKISDAHAQLIIITGGRTNPTTPPQGQTLYFSNSGNDTTGIGSEQLPWATVAKANSLDLLPGSTLLFEGGDTFSGDLEISDNGDSDGVITVSSYGTGRATLAGAEITGDWVTLANLNFDHGGAATRALRIHGASNVTVSNFELFNGTADGVDIRDGATDILLDSGEIHRFLAGSFGSETDAHGVAIRSGDGNTVNVTLQSMDIHEVSGDSIQADPDRGANSTINISVLDSVLWTQPLESNFNGGWQAGNSPGENGIDMKMDDDVASVINLTVTGVTSFGFTDIAQITNRSPFNIKERVEATFDQITTFSNEHCFRLRGDTGNGNPDVTIKNAVMYDCTASGIRVEDSLANLHVYNSTFGTGIGTFLQEAGSSLGSGSDLRNNAFVTNAKPSAFSDATNVGSLSAALFVNESINDYRLCTTATTLIDDGDTIAEVVVDREGTTRSGDYDIGAYEGSSSCGSVAPTISSATPSGTLGTETTAALGATTNQTTGTFYAVVDTQSLSGITATQIKAGQDAGGGAVVDDCTGSISSTAATCSVAGLNASTAYNFAVVQNNVNGDSNVLTGSFTTATPSGGDGDHDYFEFLSGAPQGSLVTAVGYRSNAEIEPDINANNPANRLFPPFYDATHDAAHWDIPGTRQHIASTDQIRRDFSSTASFFGSMEVKFSDDNWRADAEAGDLQTWKALQWSNGGQLTFETRVRFLQPTGDPSVGRIDFRSYSNGGWQSLSNITADASFDIRRNRWTRFFYHKTGNRVRVWVGDTDRSPVQILDRTFTSTASVNQFWFEFNTSQNSTGSTNLEVYGRNLVILSGVGDPQSLVDAGDQT